jgi:hypothetical protein
VDTIETHIRRNITASTAKIAELQAQKAAGAKFTKDLLRIDEAIAGEKAKLESWETQLGRPVGEGRLLQYNPATGEIE